jgi:hypothetical protein
MALQRKKASHRLTGSAPPPPANPPEALISSTLRTAILGAVVTGLLGLATVCAVYIWDTAGTELNKIYDSQLAQVTADHQWIMARSAYEDSSEAALRRSTARTAEVRPYASRIGDYKQLASPELGSRLHMMSLNARAEAEKDRGALSAFSPSQMKLAPEQVKPQIDELVDEIAMLESLDALIETVQQQGAESADAKRAWNVSSQRTREMSSYLPTSE